MVQNVDDTEVPEANPNFANSIIHSVHSKGYQRYKMIVPVRHMLGVYFLQLSLVCKRELLMQRQQDLLAVDQMSDLQQQRKIFERHKQLPELKRFSMR